MLLKRSAFTYNKNPNSGKYKLRKGAVERIFQLFLPQPHITIYNFYLKEYLIDKY